MLKTVRLIGPWFILAHVIALHVFIAWFQGPGDAVAETQAPGEVAAPEAPVAANEALGGVLDEPPEPEPVAPPLVERPGPLDPDRIYVDGAQTLAELDADWLAELTLDPELQATATRMLTRGKVPFGAVVVVDVKTGDVLAMADRYDEQHAIAPKLDPKGPPHLALRALAPAASVFKMVTAAALIESGVSPSREFAYKTGSSKIYGDHLEDLGAGAPKTDMIDAFADSNNGFFARLADQKLSREAIELMARRFGFNQVLPFPLLTDASVVRVPRNRLERARTAAGFWHSRLTPLHAALMAAAVAGDGSVPTPRLVRRLRGPGGRVVEAPDRPAATRAMRPETAKQMRKMMARTITHGTGRRAFAKWPKKLAAVKLGGKTGTLALRDPYTSYTWFVGFAPLDDPQIAIAVMVGNGELWWQRAIDIARDTLAEYFQKKAEKTVAAR